MQLNSERGAELRHKEVIEDKDEVRVATKQ